MRRIPFAVAALAGALLATAPVRAQAIVHGKAFELTPYAGYMVFGHMADGPLGTSLGAANGPLYGAQLGMMVAPSVSIVGNVGYANAPVKAGIPFLGGISVGHSTLVAYDAGVQLDVPTAAAGGLALRPFVQGGVGAMHYALSEGVLQTTATNFAANLGAGADLALGGNAAIRLMAKDYIGKFDFKEAIGFDAPASRSHSIALTAGLRLDF